MYIEKLTEKMQRSRTSKTKTNATTTTTPKKERSLSKMTVSEVKTGAAGCEQKHPQKPETATPKRIVCCSSLNFIGNAPVRRHMDMRARLALSPKDLVRENKYFQNLHGVERIKIPQGEPHNRKPLGHDFDMMMRKTNDSSSISRSLQGADHRQVCEVLPPAHNIEAARRTPFITTATFAIKPTAAVSSLQLSTNEEAQSLHVHSNKSIHNQKPNTCSFLDTMRIEEQKQISLLPPVSMLPPKAIKSKTTCRLNAQHSSRCVGAGDSGKSNNSKKLRKTSPTKSGSTIKSATSTKINAPKMDAIPSKSVSQLLKAARMPGKLKQSGAPKKEQTSAAKRSHSAGATVTGRSIAKASEIKWDTCMKRKTGRSNDKSSLDSKRNYTIYSRVLKKSTVSVNALQEPRLESGKFKSTAAPSRQQSKTFKKLPTDEVFMIFRNYNFRRFSSTSNAMIALESIENASAKSDN